MSTHFSTKGTTMRGAEMRAILAGRRSDDDDGFAMLTVIMLIMVCTAISVLMLGVVVAQVKPTVFEAKNTRTISAAEAGIDASLSILRTALGAPDVITGQISGDPRKLPCTVGGTVGGTSTSLRYNVAITYFKANPASKDATWRAANKMTCVVGSGLSTAPAYAIITSVGGDAAVGGYDADVGNRTLESLYTFQVLNATTAGGTIYTFGDGYCLQATWNPPRAGSTVSYIPATSCRTDGPRLLWSYGTDYGIHLAVTDLSGTKLCLTGSAGATVTLQACTGAFDQLFSWEGGAVWRGENSSKTGYSSECLGTGDSALTDLTDKLLTITTSCASNGAWGSFDPDPRVGAGAAGYTTHQIVNFLEFGRCMDVTNEQVWSTFMISYPCKQDPSGGSLLAWNHKWYYSEPTGSTGSLGGQKIQVNDPWAGAYCLTTPATSVSPAYPTMTPCGSDPKQIWTRTAKAATSYADSWTFTDTYGRCISLGDKMDGSWSKLLMATCNGGPEQKWNAPATTQGASLDNFKELN